MEKVKKAYIAPLLTVVEFRTERGYEGSAAITWETPAQQINMFIMTESGMITEEHDENGNLAAGYMGGQEDHSGDGSSSNWSYANGGWF